MSDNKKSVIGANPGAGGGSLLSLIGRLGEDVVTLLDTKLGLLKLEIKEDVRPVSETIYRRKEKAVFNFSDMLEEIGSAKNTPGKKKSPRKGGAKS